MLTLQPSDFGRILKRGQFRTPIKKQNNRDPRTKTKVISMHI